MATVKAACRLALTELNQEAAGVELAGRWAQKRFRQIAALTGRFERLLDTTEVTVPPRLDAGEVAVTQSSPLVTADATAKTDLNAALPGLSDPSFTRIFRLKGGDPIYAIAGYNEGTGTLRLAAPYASATDADTPYEVVTRWISLPRGVRHVATVHQEEGFSGGWLEELSLADMDRDFPERLTLSDTADVWAIAGEDAAGHLRLEIYPWVQDNPRHLRITFWKTAPALDLTDELPDWLDEHVLIEGLKADLAQWSATRAAQAEPGRRDINLIGFWRNEAARFESSFRNLRPEAALAARGGTRSSMRLTSRRRRLGRDIRDARDEVLNRL